MNMRAAAALVLTCALTCGAALSASSQEPGADPLPTPESMTFYIVKGAPDSCGRGCDSWIEAEGKIEVDTPARFKAILDRVRDRNLPIYFASPGGNLGRAMTLGNMLHARPIVARVGRTVVQECGFEAQDSEVCIELKNSGRELHGELLTNAVCASACPYFFLGAAVHEVALDAVLAIHSPKVMPNPRSARPDAPVTAAADQRGHERVDGMAAVYLAKMGVDAELLALTKSVKFEDIHVLTRDEIARFGFDRRESVETPWQFENGGRSMVAKFATQRSEGETAYRLLQWRLICVSTEQFELDVQRPTVKATFPTVAIGNAAAVPLYFTKIPSLAGQPQFELIESSQGLDGRRAARTALSTEGLSHALDTLLPTCPPAKDTVTAQGQAGQPAAK